MRGGVERKQVVLSGRRAVLKLGLFFRRRRVGVPTLYYLPKAWRQGIRGGLGKACRSGTGNRDMGALGDTGPWHQKK